MDESIKMIADKYNGTVVFKQNDNVFNCIITLQLYKKSGQTYNLVDITFYRELLNSKHTPQEYIRGKYILTFFVKSLQYISNNSSKILPSKKNSHSSISVGYEDAISKLCGIMRIPESLRQFLNNISDNLN